MRSLYDGSAARSLETGKFVDGEVGIGQVPIVRETTTRLCEAAPERPTSPAGPTAPGRAAQGTSPAAGGVASSVSPTIVMPRLPAGTGPCTVITVPSRAPMPLGAASILSNSLISILHPKKPRWVVLHHHPEGVAVDASVFEHRPNVLEDVGVAPASVGPQPASSHRYRATGAPAERTRARSTISLRGVVRCR